jgi:hypothetical protein
VSSARIDQTATTIMMTANQGATTTRRRFIKAAAAGFGAASVSGFAASCAGGSEPPTAASGLADAVLEAFKTHRLVGLGQAEGLQTQGDALTLLLSDPRLPGLVDDIVVEFGNALYQHTIDRFIAGQPVEDADLRLVWRNTTLSPFDTLDEPMHEQAYRAVRAANWPLPADKRMRVLLGGTPIDWSKTRTRRQYLKAASQPNDGHMAAVVKNAVVAKGRRALLVSGADAFIRPNVMERLTGERVYAIVAMVPTAGNRVGLAKRLSGYPRFTVIPAAGTWLGSVDAQLALASGPEVGGPKIVARKGMLPGRGRGGRPKLSVGENFCGQRVDSLIDAALYLGQPEEMTLSLPNPAIYLDPAYWAELQRRNTIGISVDLDWWRQRHSVRPQRSPPRSQPCGKHAQQ